MIQSTNVYLYEDIHVFPSSQAKHNTKGEIWNPGTFCGHGIKVHLILHYTNFHSTILTMVTTVRRCMCKSHRCDQEPGGTLISYRQWRDHQLHDARIIGAEGMGIEALTSNMAGLGLGGDVADLETIVNRASTAAASPTLHPFSELSFFWTLSGYLNNSS